MTRITETQLRDLAGYTPEQAATVHRMADALAIGWPLTFGQPDRRVYALTVARTCLNAITFMTIDRNTQTITVTCPSLWKEEAGR